MQKNGLNEQQLKWLDNIKTDCQNILLNTGNDVLIAKLANYIYDTARKIQYNTNGVDPVFKEFLDRYNEDNYSNYIFSIKESFLFKKLIEKVITLEQNIEELKSK